MLSIVANDWREYQSKAAVLFGRIGFDVHFEHKVKGARATHSVDVWATSRQFGIEVKWLIECKFWNSRVPKEKVLALIQIAQDIGADKAFLLSETGFQSGAIAAAKNTNVVLSSLDDLEANAISVIAENEISVAEKHLYQLTDRLRALLYDEKGTMKRLSGLSLDDVVAQLGIAFELQLGIGKASVGRYPILIHGSRSHSTVCENSILFSKLLREEIECLKSITTTLEANAHESRDIKECNEELFEVLKNFMFLSEKALFEKMEGDPGFEEDRLMVLSWMKKLANAFVNARSAAPNKVVLDAINNLWRTLLDTAYLDLSKPKIPAEQWDETKRQVTEQTEQLLIALKKRADT
jgi:hypothetical protein